MFVVYLLFSLIAMLIFIFSGSMSMEMIQIWLLVTMSVDAFVYCVEQYLISKNKGGKDNG